MSEPQTQLASTQIELRETLRHMTEAALQYDNLRLPQLLKAIGSIASASIEIDEILVAPVNASATAPVLIDVLPTEPEAAATPFIEAVTPVEPIKTVTPAVAVAAAETKVKQPVSKAPKATGALPIPEAEKQHEQADSHEKLQPAIRFMLSQAGVQLKAPDIWPYLPEMDGVDRTRIMGKLVKILTDSVPGARVEKRGQTRGRTYTVVVEAEPVADTEPEFVELAVNDEPTITELASLEEAEPDSDILVVADKQLPPVKPIISPLIMPKRRAVPIAAKQPETVAPEQVFALTNWGLDYSLNGHKEIRLGGERLKMREAAADTLLMLAQYPDGITFHELRDALQGKGKNYDPTLLAGVLKELQHAINSKAHEKWTDEVREAADGPTRYVQLKGALPLEEFPDFLAHTSGSKQPEVQNPLVKQSIHSVVIEHTVSTWFPPEITERSLEIPEPRQPQKASRHLLMANASALCQQVDLDLFFPEKGGSTRDPKSVCRKCDIKDDCLEEAMDADDRFGVWGGLSERDRRRLHHLRIKDASIAEQELLIETARNV